MPQRISVLAVLSLLLMSSCDGSLLQQRVSYRAGGLDGTKKVDPTGGRALNCTITASETSVLAGTKVQVKMAANGASSTFFGKPIEERDQVDGVHQLELTVNRKTTVTGTTTYNRETTSCAATIEIRKRIPAACTVTTSARYIRPGESVEVAFRATGDFEKATFLGNEVKEDAPVQTLQPDATMIVKGSVTAKGREVPCESIVVVQKDLAPSCRLSATTKNVRPGDEVDLKLEVFGDFHEIKFRNQDYNERVQLITVQPESASQVYTATVRGALGKATCSETIEMRPDEPFCTITPSADRVRAGEDVDLTFILSEDADGGEFLDQLEVTRRVTRTIKLERTTTFTGFALKNGNRYFCKTIVEAVRPEPPRCVLRTEPARVPAGGSLQVVIDTYGEVTKRALDGEPVDKTPKTIVLSESRDFTAKVEGPGGESECFRHVAVLDPEAPTCTLNASASRIFKGESVSLSFAIDGEFDQVSFQGKTITERRLTRLEDPPATTTYVARVSRKGHTNTCETTVEVSDPASDRSSPPSCVLSASRAKVSLGETVELTLNTFGRTFKSFLGEDEVDASAQMIQSRVEPVVGHNEYRAVVVGQGINSICRTSVEVEPPPAPTCRLNVREAAVAASELVHLDFEAQGNLSTARVEGFEPFAEKEKSWEFALATTRIIKAEVEGPGGIGNCMAIARVANPEAPQCQLTATPSGPLPFGSVATLSVAPSTDDFEEIGLLNAKFTPEDAPFEAQYPAVASDIVVASISGRDGENQCSLLVEVEPPAPPSCSITLSEPDEADGQATVNISTLGVVERVRFRDQEVDQTDPPRITIPDRPDVLAAEVSGPGGIERCHLKVERPRAPACEPVERISKTFSIKAAAMSADQYLQGGDGWEPIVVLTRNDLLNHETLFVSDLSGRSFWQINPSTNSSIACPGNMWLHYRRADRTIIFPGYPLADLTHGIPIPEEAHSAVVGYRDELRSYFDNEGFRHPGNVSSRGCQMKLSLRSCE